MVFPFSTGEMERRVSTLRERLAADSLDGALVHTADNVFYFGGVALQAEWGRPMWYSMNREGNAALIGAMLELENMQSSPLGTNSLAYDDDHNVYDSASRLFQEFVGSPGRSVRRLGVERRHLSVGIEGRLRGLFDGVELVEIGDTIDNLRILKSQEEVDLLTLGGQVAQIGANAFLSALTPGATELAVTSEAVSAMNRAIAAMIPDAFSASYSFCHLGLRTLNPHLLPTGRQIHSGDLVALNVFPVIWGYCMELERTFVLGEPSKVQLAAWQVATDAFNACKEATVAGANIADVDLLSKRIFSERGYGDKIRHGSGHAHGIMMGAASREELGELRSYNPGVLREGMVNSVEPAVFLPGVGAFRHSDVLVIGTGSSRCITEFPVVPSY